MACWCWDSIERCADAVIWAASDSARERASAMMWGRFRTGVVANLGGVHTGGAQLGLILGLGLVGVLPSLLRLGDVALNLGGALVEDRIELLR